MDANTNKNLWVFTPSRTAPEDLEFIFVQRHALLKDTVERVKESVLTKHKHHLLFVGPRGCGKTHFVSLVVHRVSQDQEMTPSARIAWLNEDATSNTLLEFLLKIYQALAKRYPEQFTTDQIAEAYEMKPAAAQTYVGRQLLAHLGTGTIVIVMENLDALMISLGQRGQQEWRAFLQENPRFCIVATAQRLVPDLSSREKPFYGFFQTEYLKPLSLDQAMELMHNIAVWRSLPDLTTYLRSTVGHARVQALHHLSGGNHRIYLVLSQFVTRDTLDALVPLFMKMLDELTPYYQERLRWLPDQQRMIVEYLCGSELTVPVKQIAKRLFATPQTISSQLQELREKGYVESNQRGRESLYEISEPLMRLTVEVKDNPLSPLPLLVNFLRVWYDERDLHDHLATGAANDTKRYVATALERNAKEGSLRQKIFLQGLEATLAEHPDCLEGWDLEDRRQWSEQKTHALQLHAEGRTEVALTYLAEELVRASELTAKADMHQLRGYLALECGQFESAVIDLTAAINLPNATEDLIATALFNRGGAYRELGRYESGIADYTSVIEMHRAPLEILAMAFTNRGFVFGKTGHLELAISDYSAVIALPGAPINDVAMALNKRGVTFGQLNQHERALADFTTVLEMPNTRPLLLAQALFNRGVARMLLGQIESALSDCSAVIELQAPANIIASIHFLRSYVYFRLARWQEGLRDLEIGLEIGKALDPKQIGYPEDQLQLIFTSGLQPRDRTDQLGKIWQIYATHQLLSALGQGAISQLGEVHQAGAPYPPAEHLDQWLAAWETIAADAKAQEFALPLRLLRVGIAFLKTGGTDHGVLLTLTKPERKILQQAFGIATD